MKEKILKLIEKLIKEEKIAESQAGTFPTTRIDYWEKFYYCHQTLKKLKYKIEKL